MKYQYWINQLEGIFEFEHELKVSDLILIDGEQWDVIAIDEQDSCVDVIKSSAIA